MRDHQSSFGDRIEETLIAIILGLMTMVTFINVIVRKLFANDPPVFIEMLGLENIGLWGGELTVFMFGWLGLLDASYAVKKVTPRGGCVDQYGGCPDAALDGDFGGCDLHYLYALVAQGRVGLLGEFRQSAWHRWAVVPFGI